MGDTRHISDIVPERYKDTARKLAENHVDWLLEMMRPLMITEFEHGFRHGWESAENAHEEDFIEEMRQRNEE